MCVYNIYIIFVIVMHNNNNNNNNNNWVTLQCISGSALVSCFVNKLIWIFFFGVICIIVVYVSQLYIYLLTNFKHLNMLLLLLCFFKLIRNANFWLIECIIAGLDFFYQCMNIDTKIMYYCIIQCAVSLFCTDSHGELDSVFVCVSTCEKETRNVSWLSACDIRHCVRPLPTFPHTYTQAAAPLVIHHLSEKIEEGLLWSFLMEKKASKPPSPPPSPFSLRPRAGEFSLSSFSPSVSLLPLFSSRPFLFAFMFSSLRADWSASCLPLIKGHFLHHRNPIHSPLAHTASD